MASLSLGFSTSEYPSSELELHQRASSLRTAEVPATFTRRDVSNRATHACMHACDWCITGTTRGSHTLLKGGGTCDSARRILRVTDAQVFEAPFKFLSLTGPRCPRHVLASAKSHLAPDVPLFGQTLLSYLDGALQKRMRLSARGPGKLKLPFESKLWEPTT